jgi:transposase
MNETLEEFYNNLLNIESPWEVNSVQRDSKNREVTVYVRFKANEVPLCPDCGKVGTLHDHRKRRWRHLDSCNHKTIIEASIPRIKCNTHGIRQIPVSWSEKNSRFTLEFESVVLLWLKDDPLSTVAENFGISWDEVDGIMSRAVARGLKHRAIIKTTCIGIDETSFQKRHEYVTVVLDKENDIVIDILEDRKGKTLNKWLHTQQIADFTNIESISMDMWDPFINAVKSYFEKADKIIAFDRFHVAQHFSKAVNKVRSEESHVFTTSGKDNPLTHSKYQWLKNSERTDNRATKRKEFLTLTRLNLKTARAWRIKEAASLLWDYSYMGVAEKEWKSLLYWISHCRLKPMIIVGRMIKSYFWGILNAIRMKTNNCMLEAKNARIQKIKNLACGFRNRQRFRNAILFHLGGLNLAPVATR